MTEKRKNKNMRTFWLFSHTVTSQSASLTFQHSQVLETLPENSLVPLSFSANLLSWDKPGDRPIHLFTLSSRKFSITIRKKKNYLFSRLEEKKKIIKRFSWILF